jgi:hypothetical protein
LLTGARSPCLSPGILASHHGTIAERNRWRLIGEGEGIHWPSLDEDISIEGLVAGRRSGETQASLRRWLETRQAG